MYASVQRCSCGGDHSPEEHRGPIIQPSRHSHTVLDESTPAFGPRALLVAGFTEAEVGRIRDLVSRMDASESNVVLFYLDR